MTSPLADPFIIRIDKQNWNDAARDMRSRLQTWEWRWKAALKHESVTLDFSDVSFMEPWALAMFACFALVLRQRGVPVVAQFEPGNPSNRYFEQMGLPHLLATGESTQRWDDSCRNTGLHVIRSHRDVTRFIASAAALGTGALADTLDALKYGMSELTRNVVQHAQSPVGGVAIAQYFPDLPAVQVAICDAGRGIYGAMQDNYPELRSHLESLKLAVLPHASGAPQGGPYGAAENAGLGLFFCKEMCWRTGGSFWLASHDALLGMTEPDLPARGRVYRRINEWPGTMVAMHLPDQDAVRFDELLSVCRELASQARREAGSAGLDFVDDRAHVPDDLMVVNVASFLEDVEEAATVRNTTILPAILRGELLVLDFGGARFVTQSFAHALLYAVFKQPGSLTKLIFLRCTKSTEEAVRLVAAYAATYGQRKF